MHVRADGREGRRAVSAYGEECGLDMGWVGWDRMAWSGVEWNGMDWIGLDWIQLGKGFFQSVRGRADGRVVVELCETGMYHR